MKDQPRLWFTIPECASYLGRNTRSIHRLLERGLIQGELVEVEGTSGFKQWRIDVTSAVELKVKRELAGKKQYRKGVLEHE